MSQLKGVARFCRPLVNGRGEAVGTAGEGSSLSAGERVTLLSAGGPSPCPTCRRAGRPAHAQLRRGAARGDQQRRHDSRLVGGNTGAGGGGVLAGRHGPHRCCMGQSAVLLRVMSTAYFVS